MVRFLRLMKERLVSCIHPIDTLHSMSTKHSLVDDLVEVLECVICGMKGSNKALEKYIKHDKRNKMIRYLATTSSSSVNSKQSYKKKDTKKPGALGSGYLCFMRSKKTASTSKVMKKSCM